MELGDKVRVLPPFNHPFDETYIIKEKIGDNYFLEGIDGGFEEKYLEKV